MEKEGQDSADLHIARPLVYLQFLSENTNFYGNMLLCKNMFLLKKDKRETFPYFVPMISVLLCIFVKGSQSIKNNFDIFLLKSFKNSS